MPWGWDKYLTAYIWGQSQALESAESATALVWGSALVSTGRRHWGVVGGRRWRALAGAGTVQRWEGTSADGCWQAWRRWALTSAQC